LADDRPETRAFDGSDTASLSTAERHRNAFPSVAL